VPCFDVPLLPTASLQSPLSIGLPSIPGLSFGPSELGINLGQATLCCTITIPNPLNNLIPATPLPPLILNIATITAILALVDQINAFLGMLQLDCPLNSSST
jgi:hypothetical protein